MIRRLWAWFAAGKELRPHPGPQWETYDAADFDSWASSGDMHVLGISTETGLWWFDEGRPYPVQMSSPGILTVQWNESGIFTTNTPDPGELYDDWEHTPRPGPDPWPPGKPRPLP